MSEPIRWYSIRNDTSVMDRDIVSKTEALQIIDCYASYLHPDTPPPEPGMDISMLGFQKNPDEFVEVTLITPTHILVTYETPKPKKLLFWEYISCIRKDRVLNSIEALKQLISSFYDLSPRFFLRQF